MSASRPFYAKPLSDTYFCTLSSGPRDRCFPKFEKNDQSGSKRRSWAKIDELMRDGDTLSTRRAGWGSADEGETDGDKTNSRIGLC